MKTTTTILLLLTIWTNSYGQDGSNIRYFKVQGVDSTLIGQDVHFDFFNRSFGRQTIDTVKINIDNRQIKFVEVRKDNGYNNWFSQQSLQSIDKFDGLTMRISKFKLDSITSISFQVTMYVDFYDTDNKLLQDKSRQIEYWFDKKDITEVLVKSKQR
jgi:hypothetical protein